LISLLIGLEIDMSSADYIGRLFRFLITMVYEGLICTCDQSTNIVLFDAVEKRNENGRVVEAEPDIVMLRGDQVCSMAPNERHAAHFTTSDTMT
jgi:hypothetical protein